MVHLEPVTGHQAKFVLEQATVLEASTEQVFGMLTEPTKLAQWWGPHGYTTPDIQVDLRVGGSLRFTMQPPDGEAFHLSGEFLEILLPSRLRFTFRWDEPSPDDRETLVELSLDSHGGRTVVKWTQGEFATRERLELHRRGWADSFAKLDAILKAGEP
jgi:uncharacterized protein YndB with AHSA1/START domain